MNAIEKDCWGKNKHTKPDPNVHYNKVIDNKINKENMRFLHCWIRGRYYCC